MATSETEIGSFEAKTKLAALLERVRQGESFVITKHAQPVARLVSAALADDQRRREAAAALRAARSRYRLRGLKVADLRAEGRA